MLKPTRSSGAFTIVELLVVVSIIGLLIAMLLPALSGVQKRSKKNNELSLIRQTYFAWSMYANSNDDSALPGFITTPVHQAWKTEYQFPDHSIIPPAPGYGSSEKNLAGPYTWRLASYLDYNHEALHGYMEEELDLAEMSEPAEAEEIAYHPWFGYNAVYLGGWWETDNGRPMYRYARGYDGVPLAVVSTKVSHVQRPASFITFCTASPGGRNLGDTDAFEPGDTALGIHVVVPPWLDTRQQWRHVQFGDRKDVSAIVSMTTHHYGVPIGRFTGQAAIVHADGHTATQTPGALLDMRLWVNGAKSATWTHQASFSPD